MFSSELHGYFSCFLQADEADGQQDRDAAGQEEDVPQHEAAAPSPLV